jgi:hypothetical protein
MEIVCKQSKEKAILAGIEPSPTGDVTVEIDLSTLTPAQREMLALNPTPWIVEPTQKGVIESIQTRIEEERLAQAEREQLAAAKLAECAEWSRTVEIVQRGTASEHGITWATYGLSDTHPATWDAINSTDPRLIEYDALSTRLTAEAADRTAAARAAVQPQIDAAIAAETAKVEAAKIEEEESQIKCGDTMRTVSTWEVVSGCVHVPESGRGGQWLATVQPDKSERSGFRRSFWDRGAAGYARVPGSTQPGDWVENGVKDKKGRNSMSYYRVLAVTPSEIIVREADTPTPASADKPIQPEIDQAVAKGLIPSDAQSPALTDEPVNPLAQYSVEQLQAEIERRNTQSMGA